jgi:hypothetical protein
VGGHCEKVECTTNAACPSGRSCVDHHCRDCVTDAQCGSTGVCRSNSCVCVECKGAQQCAVDQKCNSENSCVPFCEEGRIFGSDGNRICKTCVNPNTAKRCNEFPGCGRKPFAPKASASIAAVSIHRILMDSSTISATFATFPIPMAFPTVRTATRSSISPAYARCWSGAGSTNPSARPPPLPSASSPARLDRHLERPRSRPRSSRRFRFRNRDGAMSIACNIPRGMILPSFEKEETCTN